MDAVLDTISAVHPLMPLLSLLKFTGKIIMLGSPKALELPIMPLLAGKSSIIYVEC